jgi:hypothetical protein
MNERFTIRENRFSDNATKAPNLVIPDFVAKVQVIIATVIRASARNHAPSRKFQEMM